MSIARDEGRLDFSGLSDIDARNVQKAIARGDDFQGYIPSEALVSLFAIIWSLQGFGPWISLRVNEDGVIWDGNVGSETEAG